MSGSAFNHLLAPRRQWWLVVVTGALTLICGSIGLWQYEHESGHSGKGGNEVIAALVVLYHSIQMLILHTPHFDRPTNGWLEAGRWLGAFTLVATTWMLLWKRLAHEFRLFRLAGWHGHHVVCGIGEKGMGVVRSLKEKNPAARVVVIDPHPDHHFVDECAELGVSVILDEATKPEVLAQARVALAREVIVVSPADETNVGIAMAVRAVCAGSPAGTVNCFVHLSDIHLRERLQKLGSTDAGNHPACTLGFFDVFDDEARRVLTSLPLDGDGIAENSPLTVHLVILGFGRMGRSLALRAAKMGHFANRKPLRISVIDREAERQREKFLFRYPALEKAGPRRQAICDLDFHQADVESITARKLVEGWAAEPDTLMHLFVCVDDNTSAIELGLRFQEALVRYPGCNLRVRIKTRSSMPGIFDNPAQAAPPLRIFGTVEDGSCENAFRKEHNEAFARAAHKDFVSKRRRDSNRDHKGDPALEDWSKLQEDLRESNRQQADHAAIKLRAFGCEAVAMSDLLRPATQFTAREIELLAEMEHARWNAERFLAGWHYGTPSNKPLRVNENLLPWADLHDSIRKYDREAVANIPVILGLVEPPMKVVRRGSEG